MLTFNIAVVFPGQGSQSVGMLKAYTETSDQVEQTFQQASEVLGY
ncbi:MAG: malonyl CoA-acyl carrier protein transacylase, partial [Gammaproteobacteria bacterium]